MSSLIRRHSCLTTYPRRAVGPSLVLASVCLTVGAQSSDPPVGLLEVKTSAMQQEVERLAEAGVDIVLAHLGPELWLLTQRSPETGARSYLFVEDLKTLLTNGQINAGYRLLPQTLTRGKKAMGLGREYFCAVFQKVPGDDVAREYVFVSEPTAGDLEKKARAMAGGGLVPVAIYSHGPAVGIFERQAQSQPWKILATKRRETMERELLAAAADGYRIVAGGGGAERVLALVQRADAAPVEYRILEAGKSGSLTEAMNEMAAEGFRFTGASLLSVGGSGSLGDATDVVMERMPAPSPTAYRVVGARQAGTIQKELWQAAAAGFRIVAATVGYRETVIVMARASGETITTVPAPASIDAVRPGGGVSVPIPLREVKPEYTRRAMLEGVQGEVWLECVVLPDGTVGQVTVVRSLHPDLDAEAISAAKQWRFTPGMRNGSPVAVLVTLSMSFALKWDDENDPSSAVIAIDKCAAGRGTPTGAALLDVATMGIGSSRPKNPPFPCCCISRRPPVVGAVSSSRMLDVRGR